MHPAKLCRIIAAVGTSAVVAIIATVGASATNSTTTVVTTLAAGLTETVSYGAVVVSQTTDPVTGVTTTTRTQDTFVTIDRTDHAEYDSCPGSGEVVLISGKTTLRFTTMTNGDGQLHETTHTDSHGQGISPSGVKYVFGATSDFSHNSSAMTETQTQTNEDDFIRTTETTLPDDWFTHATFHFTIVNGVTTSAWVDDFREGCR